MHVPTATLIGLVLAVLPIAAIVGIVWITRLAARPIRPVPPGIRLVREHVIGELHDDAYVRPADAPVSWRPRPPRR